MSYENGTDLRTGVEDRALDLAHGTTARLLDGREWSDAELLLEEYDSRIRALMRHPRVARLGYVTQFGVQRYNGKRFDDYVRLLHSLDVAAANLALALRLRFSRLVAIALFVIGVIHDIGHFAFSHDQEHKIARFVGYSHEERGLYILKTDRSLRKLIAAFGVRLEMVEMIMHELGVLGHVAGLGDGIAYIYRDPRVIGIGLPFDISKLVLDVTTKVRADGSFEATDVRPFIELVECRAGLHRNVYNSEFNRIVKAAVWMLLEQIAAAKGEWFWTRCVTSVDAQLLELVMKFPDRFEFWAQNAKDLLRGDDSALEEWIILDFDTAEERAQFIEKEVGHNTPLMWLDPPSYWKKVFRVWTPDGKLHKVRSDPTGHIGLHASKYRLFVFRT